LASPFYYSGKSILDRESPYKTCTQGHDNYQGFHVAMKNYKHMKTGKVLLAMTGAAIAGVMIGMLIAPEKGKKLRRRLVEGAGEFACHLGDGIQKGMSRFDEFREDLKNEVAGIEVDLKRRSKATATLNESLA
jgi:gas vesicle protein